MLDLLDKELERRGHKFCRYADDCNVYVRSMRAGKRVMQSLTNFIEKKLKLKVNQSKSAVDGICRRNFLGFTFTSDENPKIRLSPKAIKQFKDRVRKLTLAGKGTRMNKVIAFTAKYCKGWLAYFNVCNTPSKLKELVSWLRRKLRAIFWKQWKTGVNRYKQLRKLGINYDLAKQTAGSNKGRWRISLSPALCIGLPNSYFEKRGIPKFICRTRNPFSSRRIRNRMYGGVGGGGLGSPSLSRSGRSCNLRPV